MAIDSRGNVFFSDPGVYKIRVIAKADGTIFGIPVQENRIYTVTGTGTPGFTESPTPAQSTQVSPGGLNFDNHDNLFFADRGGAIRAIAAVSEPEFFGYPNTTPNTVYSVAGKQTSAYAGDGGPARNAYLSTTDVAVDSKGNLYIPDSSGRVRFVPRTCGVYWGQYMNANSIYSIAGVPLYAIVNYDQPSSIYFGDGDLATSAGFSLTVHGVATVALDPNDNLYIGDYGNGRVRFVPNCGDSVIPQPTPMPTASNTYCVEPSPPAPPAPAVPIAEGPLLDVGYDKDGNVFYGEGSGPYKNWAQYFMRPVSNGFYFGRPMQAGQPTVIAGSERGNFWFDNGTVNANSIGLPGHNSFAKLVLDHNGNFYTTALLNAGLPDRQVLFVARDSGSNFNTNIPAGYAYRLAGSTTNGWASARGTRLFFTGDLRVDPSGNVLVGVPDSRPPFMIGAATGSFFGLSGVVPGNIYDFNTNAVGYGSIPNGYEYIDLVDGGEFKRVPPSVDNFALDSKGNMYFWGKSGYASPYSPPPPVHNYLWMRPTSDGRYFGRQMQANHIYKIAGGGNSHAEGIAGQTSHIVPWDLAIDRNGNVLFTDGPAPTATGRIRFVASEGNPGNFAYGTGVNPGCVYSLIGGGISPVDPLLNLDRAENLDVHASGRVLFTGYLKGDNKQKLWDIPLAP